GAAADQYAVDRLQIVEVDRGVDWFFKQSRAAARDQKQNERLFRVVYAQNVQGLRRRFQTTGVRQWMSTDDYRQESRRLPDDGVGRDQSSADAVAENFLHRPRHRRARFADGDDDDAFEPRQLDRIFADLDVIALQPNERAHYRFNINRRQRAMEDF